MDSHFRTLWCSIIGHRGVKIGRLINGLGRSEMHASRFGPVRYVLGVDRAT